MIMSGLRVADGDIGSSLRRGVKRAFSGGVFAHSFPLDLQSVGVVDESVEDGVGERGVAEFVMMPSFSKGSCVELPPSGPRSPRL